MKDMRREEGKNKICTKKYKKKERRIVNPDY